MIAYTFEVLGSFLSLVGDLFSEKYTIVCKINFVESSHQTLHLPAIANNKTMVVEFAYKNVLLGPVGGDSPAARTPGK